MERAKAMFVGCCSVAQVATRLGRTRCSTFSQAFKLSAGVSLIEWSQLIEEILPEHVTEITIEKDLEKEFDYRKIRVEEK